MLPILSQDKDEKTSNVHPCPHNPAPSAVMSTLTILEEHYGKQRQQQHPKASTSIKSEATGSRGWTERDFPFTPKSLRPSLVAPVLVSPAVSDISQDSFEDGDHFWGTPLWDGKDRSGMLNLDTLTPLTPPSSSQRARSARFGGAESPLLEKTRRQAQFISDTVLKSELHNTNIKCDAEATDDDYFSSPLQRIFRVDTLLETSKCYGLKFTLLNVFN